MYRSLEKNWCGWDVGGGGARWVIVAHALTVVATNHSQGYNTRLDIVSVTSSGGQLNKR